LVYTEKASEAVERLVESTRDSYQTVLDHAVGLQERNVRFAQGLVDTSIKELTIKPRATAASWVSFRAGRAAAGRLSGAR